jgi:hypothetical protein
MSPRSSIAVATAAAVAFAAGYVAPTRFGTNGPTLVFGCPTARAGAAGDVSGIASRARVVEAAALEHRGGTADAKTAPQVIAIVALGLPGLDPSSTGTLFADAQRRCRRVGSAWAIVSFRRSGSADACCLDTIFVALDGRRWFVF